MLKLRLKRIGRKKQPFYRIVLMNARTKRDGAVIEELGFYNPLNKEFNIKQEKLTCRLHQGAQLTRTLKNLLKKKNLLEKKFLS